MTIEQLIMTLDLDERVIAGQARFIICNRGIRVPDKLHKIELTGMMVTREDIPELDGNFDMIECDVILIPKILHQNFNKGDGNTISYMRQYGFSPTNWGKQIKMNEKK